MNPKEKAKELFDLFSKHAKYWDCYNDIPLEINHTIQCALITVDEIISTYTNKDKTYWLLTEEVRYWQEVKQELLNMK